MNAVELVRIARRHRISIVADPAEPHSVGFVITGWVIGADLANLPEHSEVADFKAHFAENAAELRWLLDAGLIDSGAEDEEGGRMDDAPPRDLVDLDELDGIGG